MSRRFMARTAIISPNPVSRVWRGRSAPRSRSILAPPVKCPPPRVSSAAEPLIFHALILHVLNPRRRMTMPVYTVHAPITAGADLRATDRFVFVRDGFRLWAAVLGVVWLAWHRLWLATIGWIIVMAAVDVALVKMGVGSGTILLADCLLALLLGL